MRSRCEMNVRAYPCGQAVKKWASKKATQIKKIGFQSLASANFRTQTHRQAHSKKQQTRQFLQLSAHLDEERRTLLQNRLPNRLLNRQPDGEDTHETISEVCAGWSGDGSTARYYCSIPLLDSTARLSSGSSECLQCERNVSEWNGKKTAAAAGIRTKELWREQYNDNLNFRTRMVRCVHLSARRKQSVGSSSLELAAGTLQVRYVAVSLSIPN